MNPTGSYPFDWMRSEPDSSRQPMSHERSFHAALSLEHIRSCAVCQWTLDAFHEAALEEDLLRNLDRA